jgi:hypothetical protein
MKIPFSRRIPRLRKRKLYLWVPERGVEEEKIVVSSQLMSCPLDEVGGGREYTVAKCIEALHYKPEGRGFDSKKDHWAFSLTVLLRSVHTLNRNEYQGYIVGGKGSRSVGLTT